MTKDEAKHHLTGPVMSLRTPFDRDGKIDFEGVRRVIDASLEGGSRTIMLTVGDSHYLCLTDEEITELTRVTCEYTAGRGMVIAADRYHSTNRAIAFAKFARDAGADMVMCLPPDWEKSCTAETLAKHYAEVAKVMPVMIVTNRFLQRGGTFGLETIERSLDASRNVIAIKDDMCGTFAHDLCTHFHERMAIIAGGEKRNHMNMWPYGCDGYLSTFVTFNPTISRAYWNAIETKDIPTATRIIGQQDMPWMEYLMTMQGSFDAGIHGMLELYGLAQRYRRTPYYTLNDQEMEQLKDSLQRLRLL